MSTGTGTSACSDTACKSFSFSENLLRQCFLWRTGSKPPLPPFKRRRGGFSDTRGGGDILRRGGGIPWEGEDTLIEGGISSDWGGGGISWDWGYSLRRGEKGRRGLLFLLLLLFPWSQRCRRWGRGTGGYPAQRGCSPPSSPHPLCLQTQKNND